jgi:hypothetical protein
VTVGVKRAELQSKPNGLKSPEGREWRKTLFCFLSPLFVGRCPTTYQRIKNPLESRVGNNMRSQLARGGSPPLTVLPPVAAIHTSTPHLTLHTKKSPFQVSALKRTFLTYLRLFRCFFRLFFYRFYFFAFGFLRRDGFGQL